jgi:hypothetical protein
MSILLLFPGLISLVLVLRRRIETAFLSVYLPCLLCLPDDFRLRLPHLPPISTAEFALIPLGVIAVSRLIRAQSFALMDALVVLFASSMGLSEILHAPIVNDGIFAALDAFISIFLAYAVGRKLIEPDLRLATVRRFVTLVLLDGPFALYEWRMGQSLYGLFAQRVLGVTSVTEGVQLRSGHGRIGSVFDGGEPGGIAFAMTFCLNAWLVYLRRTTNSLDPTKILTKLEKYHVPALLLLLYVWATQSRGPLIALAAAYLILQIPRFKRTGLMTIVVAAALAVGYLGASAYLKSYTNVYDPMNMSEQQSSAYYRRIMNEVYPPIAAKGGLTGYGVVGIPHVQGMLSIDNHYLLVHLAWGWLGYILFLAIAWENIRVLLVRSRQFDNLQDRAFIFSMLAAMTVLWITLVTVFLGGQLPQISFLLIGWIQSIEKGRGQSAGSSGNQSLRNASGFYFRRVFH